jgi:uncharacterized protein (DUF1778 family)
MNSTQKEGKRKAEAAIKEMERKGLDPEHAKKFQEMLDKPVPDLPEPNDPQ